LASKKKEMWDADLRRLGRIWQGMGGNDPSGKEARSGAWASVLGGLAAILLALAISLVLLDLVPEFGLGIALFPLYSEEVGIDLYGAVLPILLSVVLVVMVERSNNIEGRSMLFRGRLFWASAFLLSMIALAVFGLVQANSGSLVAPVRFGSLFATLGAVVGLAYTAERRNVSPLGRAAELYVIGVLGMFLSDLVRTFTGWSQAPGEALVWGGGGSHDLVLWFGFYMAVSSVAYGASYHRIGRFLDSFSRPKV